VLFRSGHVDGRLGGGVADGAVEAGPDLLPLQRGQAHDLRGEHGADDGQDRRLGFPPLLLLAAFSPVTWGQERGPDRGVSSLMSFESDQSIGVATSSCSCPGLALVDAVPLEYGLLPAAIAKGRCAWSDCIKPLACVPPAEAE
jgi:hypothetical protein